MQRTIWILSIKTSLPEYCRDAGSLRTSIFAFDTFAEARVALLKALKHYAYSKNNLFDGCGYLNNYGKYFWDDTIDDPPEDAQHVSPEKSRHLYIRDLFHRMFDGEDVTPELERARDNGVVFFTYDDGQFRLYGDEGHPFWGTVPTIKTNMFSMEKEQNYYLYLHQFFGEDYTSDLYIDLQKPGKFTEEAGELPKV